MEERKTLGYDWEFGHEELMLEVGAYTYGDRLYIGLLHMEDGMEESFADLTINLPYSPAEKNEAYIDTFAEKSKLDFIRKHKLGKVLPEMGYSGYGKYRKVTFDLDRLAEFDPKGLENYRKLYEAPEEKQEKDKKRNRREKER